MPFVSIFLNEKESPIHGEKVLIPGEPDRSITCSIYFRTIL